MALSIKAPEADRLARELARVTGESLTEAVVKALRERLIRTTGRSEPHRIAARIRRIRDECAQLPILDNRPEDEILGYDDHGVPRDVIDTSVVAALAQ